ncbi:hypothetical protein JF66_14945 [Cryobacterium sp. MLB-32]|nr:hypothetical protein JF66_14945 [Cryobacterium sp. MLB-32]
MSRFKNEVHNVLAALGNQRRVLISRHGTVVASIEPPAEQHARLLLDFATRPSTERQVAVLTMTDIGHGSPSEAIRNAENGIQALLTYGGRVRGVLTSKPEAEPLEAVDERASALATYARTHPDATPHEFAEFADSLVANAEAPVPAPGPEENVASQWLDLLSSLGTMQLTKPAAPELVTAGDVIYVNFSDYKDRAIKMLAGSYDEVGLLTNAALVLPGILHIVRPGATHMTPQRAELLRTALGTAEQAVRRAGHAVRSGPDSGVGLDYEDSTHT